MTTCTEPFANLADDHLGVVAKPKKTCTYSEDTKPSEAEKARHDSIRWVDFNDGLTILVALHVLERTLAPMTCTTKLWTVFKTVTINMVLFSDPVSLMYSSRRPDSYSKLRQLCIGSMIMWVSEILQLKH